MSKHVMTGLVLVLGVSAFVAGPAQADDFPSKPITLIAPNNPGTNPDTVARIMAAGMSKVLGQPIIVQNKPSSNGIIGYGYVAKQVPADGYTLVTASVNELASLKVVSKDLNFEPLKDLTPIIDLSEGRNVLGSYSGEPWKSFTEMVAYAKAHPGQLNYGSPGANVRIPMEAILRSYGIKVAYIPYSGGGPYLLAVSSGEVQMGMMGDSSAATMGDRFRVLAITGDERRPPFQDVPTFKELGHPEIPSLVYSLNVTTGTPKAVIDKLHAAAEQALQQPDVKERFKKVGMEVVGGSEEASATRLAKVGELFSDTAAQVGIKPE